MKINRTLTTLIAGLGIVVSILIFASNASAITGSDFQAGRIIDDGVFFDGNAMSTQQIQSFLFTQVPTCDTNGSQIFTGYYNGTDTSVTPNVNHSKFAGRHSYTLSDNVRRSDLDDRYPAPYTCLKDYVENPTTHENNIGRPTYVVPGGMSAASILAASAQTYSISPKVLLTLIQKESVGALIMDDWPWPDQYVHPTGFACPDTALCDSTYNGFYNQVKSSAAQFRKYTNNPTGYSYRIGANSIKWHPDFPVYAADGVTFLRWENRCGFASVNIVNQATANLYIYTPYVPNTAALSDLYGTGDSCSAYGNRNFWRIYSNWFGSTLIPNYAWAVQNISVNADLGNMLPNQTATITYTIKNTGSSTWERDGTGTNPVRLGTSNPQDRTSAFCNTTWLGCTRPAAMTEASVPSGSNATFSFTIKAPSQTGEYREYFKPVVEGLTWLPDSTNNVYIRVVPPVYSYSVKGQGAFTDSTKTTPLDSSQLSPGQSGWYTLKITNTGNMTWSNSGANPMDLGTDGARDRSSRFATPSWVGPNRPARLVENTVLPGQDGTFEWPFVAPSANGVSREYYTPVIEGVTWLNATGLNYYSLLNGGYSWSPVGQYAYADSTQQASIDLANLRTGQRVYIGVRAKNTGTATWYPAGTYPLHLGSSHPMDRPSAFCDATWLGCNRPATMKNAADASKASVAPGETADFGFWYIAPAKTGIYYEYFNPVAESITWLNDPGVNFYTAVK